MQAVKSAFATISQRSTHTMTNNRCHEMLLMAARNRENDAGGASDLAGQEFTKTMDSALKAIDKLPSFLPGCQTVDYSSNQNTTIHPYASSNQSMTYYY